ncbi:MAG: hypothetical protein EBW74_06720 [Betaproteobacteria bacterium]|nr:hypothetical protein [Betaproteobacteria bacterium]
MHRLGKRFSESISVRSMSNACIGVIASRFTLRSSSTTGCGRYSVNRSICRDAAVACGLFPVIVNLIEQGDPVVREVDR